MIEKEMELKKEAASISNMYGVKGEFVTIMDNQRKTLSHTVNSLKHVVKSQWIDMWRVLNWLS